jgi:lipopolysaccharide export system permease protein
MVMTDVTWHRRDPTGMVTEIVRRQAPLMPTPAGASTIR